MNICNKIAGILLLTAMMISSGVEAQELPLPPQEQMIDVQARLNQRRLDIQDLTLKILNSQSEAYKKAAAQKKIKELIDKTAQDQKKIETLEQETKKKMEALEQEAIQKKQLEENLKKIEAAIPDQLTSAQEPLQKKISELNAQLDAAQKTIDQVRADTKNKIEEIALKQKEIDALNKKVEQLTDQLSLTKKSVEQAEAELKVTQRNLAKKDQQLRQTQKTLDQEGEYREQLRQDMTKDKQELESKCSKLEQELKQLKEAKKSH